MTFLFVATLVDGETRIFHLYDSRLKRRFTEYSMDYRYVKSRQAVNYLLAGVFSLENSDWVDGNIMHWYCREGRGRAATSFTLVLFPSKEIT